MDAKALLAVASAAVCNRHPYLASVALALRPVAKPGLGTLAVDAGWRLWYDPETVCQWGPPTVNGHDGIAAVYCHEVWHCLLDHFGRRGERDPKRYNAACDAEVNDDLTDARWKFPVEPILPKQFGAANGFLAEVYYDKIKDKKGGGGKAIPGCGGKCGQCAGNGHDFEESAPGATEGPVSTGQWGKDAPFPSPMSATDQELIRRVVAEEISAHVNSGIGSIPAGLRAWAKLQLAPPVVDWRKRLASLVRSAHAAVAGACDYTYSRPSRRASGLRSVLGLRCPAMPSMHRPVPNVGVVLDTSGSMTGGLVEKAAQEILGIAKAVGSPVRCWACDAAIQAVAKVFNPHDLEKLNKGAGGTELRPGIDAAEKCGCEVVVVVTDGHVPGWPANGRRKSKLVACIVGDGPMPPAHIASVRAK